MILDSEGNVVERKLQLVLIDKAGESPDSDLATLVEGVLEDDASDFFYGLPVNFVAETSPLVKSRKQVKVNDRTLIIW